MIDDVVLGCRVSYDRTLRSLGVRHGVLYRDVLASYALVRYSLHERLGGSWDSDLLRSLSLVELNKEYLCKEREE